MYLIQFGNYRIYDNAKRGLEISKQTGIDAEIRYDGVFFRVLSRSAFEDFHIAALACEAIGMKYEILAIPVVRRTEWIIYQE